MTCVAEAYFCRPVIFLRNRTVRILWRCCHFDQTLNVWRINRSLLPLILRQLKLRFGQVGQTSKEIPRLIASMVVLLLDGFFLVALVRKFLASIHVPL